MKKTNHSIAKEETLPSRSGKIFANARKAMLKVGRSVLIAKDGKIYKLRPDGSRTFVKTITAPSKMKRGMKFKLR